MAAFIDVCGVVPLCFTLYRHWEALLAPYCTIF